MTALDLWSTSDPLEVIEQQHAELWCGPLHPKERTLTHCQLHFTIECQLRDHHAGVQNALKRLQADGLTRHASIHVLIEVFVVFMRAKLFNDAVDEDYKTLLKAADASRWLDGQLFR